MGILGRLFGGGQAMRLPRIEALGESSTFYSLTDPAIVDFLRLGRGTSSGKTVSEGSAIRNATYFRAINLICGCVGMLPTNLFRKTEAGAEKAEDHPVHGLLRRKPNNFQTPLQFKAYMQGRALHHGNAYGYKIRSRGRVTQIIPLDPCRVTPELGDDWVLRYKWQRKSGGTILLPPEEVFHLRAPYSADGITGQGLIAVAAEALGLAEVADEAAARLLRNGAYVGGVLKHPKTLTKEAIERLAAQFAERHSGVENAGKWLVTEEGLEAQQFGASGRDAQGLEQRKHQAEEVSRFTGVPRPLLMFDETSWGTGIEQLGLFLITYCLMPWFVAWEEVIAQSLLTDAERDAGMYAKFKEAALLRGSLKDQAEFLAKALGGPGATGFMLPDEARGKMDLNELPGGIGKKPGWIVEEGTQNAPSQTA